MSQLTDSKESTGVGSHTVKGLLRVDALPSTADSCWVYETFDDLFLATMRMEQIRLDSNCDDLEQVFQPNGLPCLRYRAYESAKLPLAVSKLLRLTESNKYWVRPIPQVVC